MDVKPQTCWWTVYKCRPWLLQVLVGFIYVQAVAFQKNRISYSCAFSTIRLMFCLVLFRPSVHSTPFTLNDSPKPSPLQGETVWLLKTLEQYQTIHPTVLWEGLTHWVLYPLYQWRKQMDWDHPNSPPFVLLSLLSIPSHCTITNKGQTGILPRCPIGYTPCPYSPSHHTSHI